MILGGEIDSIFFDLDGTLWDCFELLKKLWKQEANADFQKSFMGLTSKEISQQTGLSLDEINRLQSKELDFIQNNDPKIYKGVIEGVKKLASRYKLFIVSNCQKGYIDAFLQKTGLQPYIIDFRYEQKDKSTNIADLIAEYGLSEPIMIGDTMSDLKAAQNNNILFIQARYGYSNTICSKGINSFEELEKLWK